MIKGLVRGVRTSSFSSYRTGGPADFFFEALTLDGLKSALEWAVSESVPYMVVGSATNVLFPDAGVRGLVIRNRVSSIENLGGGRLEVAGGTPIRAVSARCIRDSLGGAEFLTGLPGTVGGAVAGNAGAYGRSMSDLLESAVVFSRDGGLAEVNRVDMPFSYRSGFPAKSDPETVLLSVVMRLSPEASAADIKRLMREVMMPRVERHPSSSLASCGCFFKNPPGEGTDGRRRSAGAILDSCGARGMSCGGAVVSDMHCNFIVNRGGASSSDILSLARRMRDMVLEKTGVSLLNEVRIVPEKPPFVPMDI